MSPRPFTESSKHAYTPTCDCAACASFTRYRAQHPYGYGYADPPNAELRAKLRAIRNTFILSIIIFALCAAAALVWINAAQARTSIIHPVPAPQSLLKARAACPNGSSVVHCRAALRHAYDAVTWQRHARQHHQTTYGVDHALRLAAALYGVPLSELRSVGSCESHLYPLSKNQTSTASGLFQFLDSTWARAGVPGFSVFDPYANAIAAARLVRLDGSWREWSCRP